MQQQMTAVGDADKIHEHGKKTPASDVWVCDDAVFLRLMLLRSIILIYFLIII
jgi:hypothetical protein